jgi:hypothetical protein
MKGNKIIVLTNKRRKIFFSIISEELVSVDGDLCFDRKRRRRRRRRYGGRRRRRSRTEREKCGGENVIGGGQVGRSRSSSNRSLALTLFLMFEEMRSNKINCGKHHATGRNGSYKTGKQSAGKTSPSMTMEDILRGGPPIHERNCFF